MSWKHLASLSILLLIGSVAFGQQSPSYRIASAVLNSGGEPDGTGPPQSPSYLLRPGAIGESSSGSALTGAAYRLAGGFVLSFPSPGTVNNLILSSPVTLTWDVEPLAAHYHLYRTGPMGSQAGLQPIADCLQPDLQGVVATDPAVPPPGKSYLYFVAAVNPLRLEGPSGPVGVRCN